MLTRSRQRRSLFKSLSARGFLDSFWPAYAAFVNGPQPEGELRGDWVMHRRGLGRALRGQRPLRGHSVDVPLMLLDSDPQGVQWAIDGPVAGAMRRSEYRFTLMLLGLPEALGLLQRCDHCTKFFLGARARRWKQSFCSSECRYAAHRAHLNKESQAAYMRRYRRLRATRRARKKTPR